MTGKIFEWLKTHRHHVIGWSLFCTLETGLVGLSVDYFGEPLNYLLHYTLNIALFYCNAHLVLKKSFDKANPWLWASILMLVQITLYVLLRTMLIQSLSSSPNSLGVLATLVSYRNLFQSLWRGLFFILLSSFYYLFLEYKTERSRRDYAEKQKLINEIKNKDIQNALNVAEFEYLRAQINPHLLFNTLSFLYDSVRKFDTKAGEAVLHLAELMRFSLETRESSEEFPTLEEELIQINNLIKLNEIRKGRDQYITLDYPETIKDFNFPPLVLITLLENMIKHGNLRHSDRPGRIKIELDKQRFLIHTTNLINANIQNSGFKKGIDNIERRLKIAYQDKCFFKYGIVKDRYFNVSLTLYLNS